jgi:hypothetical protein
MEKINEFRQLYSHIRAYHACRPDNISTYYEKGLLLRSKDAQIERFRSIFLSGKFPELTEEMLQQSIKELTPYSDADGELCLAIDDRFIIEFCGLYLVYGSEYIAGLVNNLPIENAKKHQYLSVLREIGKPTFLEINLPNTSEYVSDGIIWEIIQEILTGWAYCLANSITQPHHLDCTVSIIKPLPPEHICSHYHPGKIPDSHMGHKIYNVETGGYEEQDGEEQLNL